MPFYSLAQNPVTPPNLLPPYDCAIEDVVNPAPRSTPCTPFSDTWLDSYRTPGFWIPDENTPLKTIKINWIVCQDSQGNGWQDVPAFHDNVQDFFDELNERFSNIPYKEYNLTCDPNADHVYDSKIRFELDQVIFLQNDAWNVAPLFGVSPIGQHIFDNYPETRGALNHIFTNGPGIAFGYYAPNVLGESFVQTRAPNLMFDDVWMPIEWAEHFAHEYGHAIGLHHSYNAEYTNVSHYDFLSDVFGTCAEPALLAGGSCHAGCQAGSQNICHLSPCFYGQFYTTDPNTNEQEPAIVDLMSGRTENRYISPRSAGRFHRALSLYDETFRINNRNMHRYVKEKYSYHLPMEITADETWDFGIKLYQDLVVKAGNTLTITCEVLMPIQGKIIVEQGATLIVDGGTIKNAHDEMWQGIEVWGNTNAPQSPATHGVVQLNNATIENAANALTNWKQGDWNSLGGIIQAVETDFTNCRRSVAFMKYANTNSAGQIQPDQSSFRFCDFENNQNHLLPATVNPPLAMVSLWDVHGVRFSGCTFTNKMPVDDFNQLSHAIFSMDANYTVTYACVGEILPGPPGTEPVCPNFEKSQFNGFAVGLWARNSSNNKAPSVRASVFKSNMVGIYFEGADFGVAVGNEFKLGGLDFDGSEVDDAQYHLGIRTTESSNWTVEENEFERDPSAPVGRMAHGVLIEKSGEGNLQLYNNDFSDMEAAVIITGNNASLSNGFDGLRLICNRNEGNNGDFEIRPDLNNAPGAISSFQSGNSAASLPGGNTFSAGDAFNTNFVNIDFNSNAHYNLWYDGSAPGQTPDSDEINVFPGTWNAYSTSTSNSCPLNYDYNGLYMRKPGDVKDEFYDVKHDYFNLLYTYEQLLDDGSTEGVLNDIAVNWSEDAWELRHELIALSPYLSDSVLMATADQNILSHGMLLEVLVANPDGLSNGRVIHHVECCIPSPMPAHMIEILEAANSLQTARTITERSLAGMHGKMLSLQRSVLTHYRHDSIPYHPDTLMVWHKEDRTLEGRYATAIEYMSREDFAQAKTTLDNAETELNVKGKRRVQLSVMRNFVDLIESAAQDGRSIAELDSTEQAALVTIATHSNAGKAGVRAQNALCFFYDNCIDPPAVPKGAPMAQKKKPRPLSALMSEEYSLTCYPNPAKDFTQVDFSLVSEGENYAIHLYDALGRRVQTQPIGNQPVGMVVLDTRNLMPGIYVVELANQGRKIRTEKLIVQ